MKLDQLSATAADGLIEWAKHKVFSNSTIMELMKWSAEQTEKPTEPRIGKL